MTARHRPARAQFLVTIGRVPWGRWSDVARAIVHAIDTSAVSVLDDLRGISVGPVPPAIETRKTPPVDDWAGTQPANTADLLERLARGRDLAVPPRELENLCAVAHTAIGRLLRPLAAIVSTLDGEPWTADTLDQIAGILRAAGYEIADVDSNPEEGTTNAH